MTFAEKEVEIEQALGRGETPPAIARRLGVNLKTVQRRRCPKKKAMAQEPILTEIYAAIDLGLRQGEEPLSIARQLEVNPSTVRKRIKPAGEPKPKEAYYGLWQCDQCGHILRQGAWGEPEPIECPCCLVGDLWPPVTSQVVRDRLQALIDRLIEEAELAPLSPLEG